MSDLFYFFIYFRCYIHFFVYEGMIVHIKFIFMCECWSAWTPCVSHIKESILFAPVFFFGNGAPFVPKISWHIYFYKEPRICVYIWPTTLSLNLQFWSSKLTRPIWPCCQQIATLLRFHTSFWDRKLICLVPYFLEAITWISLRTCSMMRTFLAWYIIY